MGSRLWCLRMIFDLANERGGERTNVLEPALEECGWSDVIIHQCSQFQPRLGSRTAVSVQLGVCLCAHSFIVLYKKLVKELCMTFGGWTDRQDRRYPLSLAIFINSAAVHFIVIGKLRSVKMLKELLSVLQWTTMKCQKCVESCNQWEYFALCCDSLKEVIISCKHLPFPLWQCQVCVCPCSQAETEGVTYRFSHARLGSREDEGITSLNSHQPIKHT
jgi:hypothetical protein